MADELRNPFTGQTIRFVEESPELLVMESSYRAGSPPAPPHLHPSQDERFVVLSGAVEVKVDGEARTLRSGDELVVPSGTPHEFGGHATEDGTVRWEVRPALRMREFFEGVFALAQSAHAAQTGGSAQPDAPVDFDVADYGDVFRLA